MSRNTLLVAVAALVIAVGALVLQFALPSGGGGAGGDLEQRIQALEGASSGLLRIGYFDAEAVFKGAFWALGENERAEAEDIADDIRALLSERQREAISAEEYATRSIELQADFLRANVSTLRQTIDMIFAAEGLISLLSQEDRLQARTVQDNAATLKSIADQLLAQARVGVVNTETFQANYTQAQANFQNLDSTMTSLAGSLIASKARRFAEENGYDLVFTQHTSLVYGSAGKSDDLTATLIEEMSAYFDF
jgi:hypothetical protein